MSTADCQRREVYYSGRVQGVGFRFTARAIAARFAVTGFVRNLPDGRVHLVAEGGVEEVQKFLRTIREEMQHYIASTHETVGPASGRFNSFGMKP